MKPLEILGSYKLVFIKMWPLHFLPLLMRLALMIVFICYFFFSDSYKGIE